MRRLRAPLRLRLLLVVGLAAAAAIPAACAAGGGDTAATAAVKRGWRALHPALLHRTEVGAGRIGPFIYVVGGFLPSNETTAAVERYDIRRNRWKRLAPMPVAVNHPAVAALGGRLYVYGGYTDSGFSAVTATLQSFDPGTGRWRRLPVSSTPRAAAALLPAAGQLFAVGGAAPGRGPLARLEAYDPAKRRWRTGLPAMQVAREHIAGAVVGRRLYVLGGRAGGRNLATVESYAIGSRAWRSEQPLEVARSGFAAVAVGDRIVAFGGEELSAGGTTIKPVELIDTDGHERRLSGMLTPRHGLGGVSYGRRIYALEGGPSPGFAFSNAAEVIELPSPRRR
jgi:N-acetylneuraminic acid mutarotase